MRRDLGLYLDDILESIKRIEKSSKNLTLQTFTKDINIQDATVRRLEVIGEAVKHIPYEFKQKYPEVAWKKIAGTRDKIIHDYFDVDLERVWNIIQNDLKPLKKQVQEMLKEIDKK